MTRSDREDAATDEASGSDGRGKEDETGAIVIFACRHIFHRGCLERMNGEGDEDGDSPASNLVCPLED